MVPFGRVTVTDAFTNIDGTTKRPLALPAEGQWVLVEVHVRISGGTAATYRPRISGVAAWTAGDANESYDPGAVIAVATALDDDPGSAIQVGSTLSAYVMYGFNAGADNDGTARYVFEYRPGR